MPVQSLRFKAALTLIGMTAFIAPEAHATGEASEVRAIVETGVSRGTALGKPWAPRESYSLGMWALWEQGQGFGARLTLLPTAPSASAWEFSADAVGRLTGTGPLYFKALTGISVTPNSSWPRRLRAGGEAGVHAIRGSIGLEVGLAGVYSFHPSRPAEGQVVLSLGVGILFGFGAPARAPALAHREAPFTEQPPRSPGGSPGPQSPVPPAAADVIQQILLLQKPGDVMSWWAAGPGKDLQPWTHPLSEWERAYLQAMSSPAVPEPIRMWPPVAPESLTPEQTGEVERLLGRGPDAARGYSHWENRRRIVKHYIMTHPATLQLSLGLYGLARDLNPLFFALERGWQMASGQELFTAQEVSRLGAAQEFFTVLASGVAAGRLMSATRPMARQGVQAPVELADRARMPQALPSPAAQPPSSVPARPPTTSGTTAGGSAVRGSIDGNLALKLEPPPPLPAPAPQPPVLRPVPAPTLASAPLPPVGQRTAAGSAVAGGVAVAGGLLLQPSRDLEEHERAAIEKALAECADAARSEIMLKTFGREPTREECAQVVGTDPRGEPITRAMQLGVAQHEAALQCAGEKLSRLRPGGFSLSPRYRYDPKTGKTEYLPREAVEELLKQGRSAELRGSIEPDIVIHEGDPRRVQDVYDYKFPCVATDRRSPWRKYPEGHPSGHGNQGDLYQEALGRLPARVQPNVGVYR